MEFNEWESMCPVCGDVFICAFPGQEKCCRCEDELCEQCITKDQIGNK